MIYSTKEHKKFTVNEKHMKMKTLKLNVDYDSRLHGFELVCWYSKLGKERSIMTRFEVMWWFTLCTSY